MINTLPESLDDLLICSVIVLLGGLLSAWTGRGLRLPARHAVFLYLWHTVFCLAYVMFLGIRGGDAVGYYLRSFDQFRILSLGTLSIVEITSYFSYGLGLSFLATNLVFNIAGALGLLFFRVALREAYGGNHWLQWVVILLPAASFWSSAIGKDSLAMLAVSLYAWAIISTRLRVWPIVVALLVMGLARPHIAVVMGAVTVVLAAFQFSTAPGRSILTILIGAGGGFYALPIVMEIVKLESLGSEEIGTFIEGREKLNSMGGSSIDISGMSYPTRVFSYLFRPLPYEASDILQLVASAENLIHLGFLTACLYFVLSGTRKLSAYRPLSLFLLGFSLILVLAITTANLGLASRQKLMALVPLYVFFFAFRPVARSNSNRYLRSSPNTVSRHSTSRERASFPVQPRHKL